uniref:Large ribosomal subunit protein bL21m n=1 Tax=Timema bartmani TaxID=61472 RepID=A0A7R9I1I3_9NEOP|nr:unnamed protein product [Timema bartmani]
MQLQLHNSVHHHYIDGCIGLQVLKNCPTKKRSLTLQLRTNRSLKLNRQLMNCSSWLKTDVIARVNAQLEQQTQGRLFAVVHAGGKQFKVTPEDIIIVEGYWPPQFGDVITLDKVLLVGASDFTLIGRPILSPELVCVSATVIEKSLSHIKTHFRKKKRKQYMRINFHRTPFTMLRINSIDLKGCVNQKKDVEGIAGRIF